MFRPDRRFDDVFLLGYEAGLTAGLRDGRATNPALAADPKDCGQGALSGNAEDCDAYRGSYRLGYSGGLANQRENSPVMAQK